MVEGLTIHPAGACRWDLAALGEVMLRLDPGEGRVATARGFRAWEGGGEYNVARGLRRCFGLRTMIVTALADNPVGRLIEDLILQGGVDASQIRWQPYDGVGRTVRNGLNFTERGFGVRGGLGCSDRGHTAVSQLAPDAVDWDALFAAEPVRWFHCGGVFAGLSALTPRTAEAAMRAARASGAVVSYDLNFRPSLWCEADASEVNHRLVELADVLFGNEEDLVAALGYDVGGVDRGYSKLEPARYAETIGRMLEDFPTLKLVATSLRVVHTATLNDWGGMCVTRDGVVVADPIERLEVLDRVGGGDSFASGLIYGLLADSPLEQALAYGVAHGALAMTTPGDTSMATLAEVQRLAAGGSARTVR